MGWEVLMCSWFEGVCRSSLDSYFHANNFAFDRADEIGGVTWRHESVYVELTYFAEESPKKPNLVIGIGNSRYFDVPFGTRVPLWFCIPEDQPARQFQRWGFSDAKELTDLCVRLRDEVIDPYARPLWLDVSKLKSECVAFGAWAEKNVD